MSREIFLDNNATTRPIPEVVAAVTSAMTIDFGNASSSHRSGDRARHLLRESRESVAELIGANPDCIHFTSGATESNNWVLQRLCHSPGHSIVTTTAEHSSIKNLCDALEGRGIRVTSVPVEEGGRVRMEHLADAIHPETSLVTVHWVNNETGTIQPVHEIAALCRERGVPFHTDASQAVGKMEVDVEQLGCDFLSFSGHKFHGPQGVGGLYVRSGFKLAPLLMGGAQEHGRRAGTENLPGIAGVGAAAKHRLSRLQSSIQTLSELRNSFESAVLSRIPCVFINGDTDDRICNTTNLRFEGVNGEALVARLDQRGLQCSQNSACTSQRPEPSYVLRAMGLSETQAYSSLRFGVSIFNSNDEIEAAVSILCDLVGELRRFSVQDSITE